MSDTKLTAELLDELERRARYNRNQMQLETSALLSLIAAARASLESRGDEVAGLFAVVCRQPSGHETIIRSLVFATLAEAKRAATKRDQHPNSGALGFTHRAESVVENPKQTGPNDKYLIATHAPSAAPAESMAGWVAVSEKKPPADGFYLVAAGGPRAVEAWYDGGWHRAHDAQTLRVSHWRPLPPSPLPSPPKVTP